MKILNIINIIHAKHLDNISILLTLSASLTGFSVIYDNASLPLTSYSGYLCFSCYTVGGAVTVLLVQHHCFQKHVDILYFDPHSSVEYKRMNAARIFLTVVLFFL